MRDSPCSSPSPSALVVLCALGAASLLSACGRDEPVPVTPPPGASSPAPPLDPNDPLQRRKDPNSLPPPAMPSPPASGPTPPSPSLQPPPAAPPSPATPGTGGTTQ